MDVGFRPDVDIPRTSSNPGEKSAGDLGYESVLGFSQVDSAQSRCGAVELGLRWANCPPGEIGAKECDYIMPALLAGSSDLECLPYQGKDCIKDFSAGRTLSPSVSDLSGPRGPYVTDGPVGHLGTLSPSTFMSEMTARQLLCPPVVAQTRPMEGCDPALPWRWRWGLDVLTEDGAVAVDTERVSAASDAVVSRETHNNVSRQLCLNWLRRLRPPPRSFSRDLQIPATRTYSRRLANVGSCSDLILRML